MSQRNPRDTFQSLQEIKEFLESPAFSFKNFLEEVYGRAFKKIEGVEFVTWENEDSFPAQLSNNIVNNSRTVTIGPRTHTKSSIFGAYALWRVVKAKSDLQILWFHYQHQRAKELIQEKALRFFKTSQFLDGMLEDKTRGAKSKLEVENIYGATCLLRPMGLSTSIRSVHADIILADDILKVKPTSTGESRGTPKEIRQASDQFKNVVALSTKKGKEDSDEIHLIGTAMDKDDLLHQYLAEDGWTGLKMPAVINPIFNDKKTKIKDYDRLAWPEFYDLDSINAAFQDLNSLRVFKKEMLCEPSAKVDSFLNPQKLDKAFGRGFGAKDRGKIETFVGGHDIGKKSNPAHAYIFGIDDSGEMYEKESEWMEDVDYTDQIGWWIRKFQSYEERGSSILLAYYDNTRSEFEAEAEQGLLPDNFKPVPLSGKSRNMVAQQLEKRVHQETIHFKAKPSGKDQKQLQLMSENLKAPEEYGKPHADNFWASAFACYAATKVTGRSSQIATPNLTPASLKKRSRWPDSSGNKKGSRFGFQK